MRISILGFGLIGGSLAQAIRRESPSAGLGATAIIGAWSPTGRGPARGLEEGAIDQVFASVDEAIDGADLIVLAGPPLACLELIQVIGRWPAARLGDTATITDVASTKSLLVAAADRGGLRFVGGHPMAGRETTGYESASAELFEGRPWVVVPGRHARPVDIDRVERLARAAGARPLQMNALDHDAAVAAISHLPLVVSAALVEAVVGGGTQRLDWPAAERLAASGWQGMTRLARGEVEMGVGIAATNAEAVARRLRDLLAVLDAWLVDLEAVAGADREASAEATASAPPGPAGTAAEAGRAMAAGTTAAADADEPAGTAMPRTEPAIERLRERLLQARAHLVPRP